MDDKIHQLIMELEQSYGAPVQISVERSTEKERYMSINKKGAVIPQLSKQTYGMLEKRPCEVIPLPTDDAEIRHDQELIMGKYEHSVNQVNEKIKDIVVIDFFVSPVIQNRLDEGLLKHLEKKHALGETEFNQGHGYCQWPTVDGVLADLKKWKTERPDLYRESISYLKEKKALFRYHQLTATLSGVYISEYGDDIYDFDLDKLLLLKKIADVKIDCFKE